MTDYRTDSEFEPVNDVPLSIRAAVALSEGAELVSHLCSSEPKSKRDLIRVGIGKGHLKATGGFYRMHKAGVIRIVATEFDGELVLSTPSKAGVYATRGMAATIGPTILAPTSGEKN